MTVSADIGRLLRFHFRDTLKPVKENKERTDVMNEAKNKNLFIRVSKKEKNIIEQNAGGVLSDERFSKMLQSYAKE